MHPESVEAGVLHVAVVGENVQLDHLKFLGVLFVLDVEGLQGIAVRVVDVPGRRNKTLQPGHIVHQGLDFKIPFRTTDPICYSYSERGCWKAEKLSLLAVITLQGDPAPCSKPPIDIDVKVVFWYKVLKLKRNFKSMSTGGLEQGAGSPCISDDFRYEKILSKDQKTTTVTGL